MHSIVMHIAESNQIVRCIRTTASMRLHVMQLEKGPSIPSFDIFHGPPALSTSEFVAFQNFNTNIILDVPVMRFGLYRMFQHIGPDGHVGATALPSKNRPTMLCTQFANAPRPLLSIASQVSQLFSGDTFADIQL